MIMDNETRFWIAQQITDNKGTSDVRPMFREAKELRWGHEPQEVISDGAGIFLKAIRSEYQRTKHTREITLDGERHNNKMERMNGEFRDREKVMRGLKTEDSPILEGLSDIPQLCKTSREPCEGQKEVSMAEASLNKGEKRGTKREDFA